MTAASEKLKLIVDVTRTGITQYKAAQYIFTPKVKKAAVDSFLLLQILYLLQVRC